MIDIVGNIFIVKFAHHHQNDGTTDDHALQVRYHHMYHTDYLACIAIAGKNT